MKCIKVQLKEIEKTRISLFNNGILNNNYKILKEDDFAYIPVKSKVEGFKLYNKKLIKLESKKSVKDLLKKEFSKKELSLLNSSFDIIGNIAIIEIEKELLYKKYLIADALLKSNKQIKTVVRKLGAHEGDFRIQNYEFLSGINTFETIHKESGISLKIDISKTYYSPRSSNERLRISKLVKDNESILVMFSGIGIYCFIISKFSKAKDIYGVEVNPFAHSMAVENLKLNKIKNVELLCGDVKSIVPKINKKFDRIVMPLPKTSLEFLKLSINNINPNGIIHFYFFSSLEDSKDFINNICSDYNLKILRLIKTGQSKPNEYRMCADLQLVSQ
ncbi:MAG: hypothetical protein AABW52_02740 [Nanoarchaeota archaeon]